MAWIYWNEEEWLISLSSDGETWLTIADKNLGATQVYNDGDTLSEVNSGKYYQWWNNYGFPFTGAVTTSSTQVNASTYWPWNYYSSSTFYTQVGATQSWDSSYNQNLWWGTTWTNDAMKWPCDIWYHVPKDTEWQTLKNIWIALWWWNNFYQIFKIPFWGYRAATTGGVVSWNRTSFWTSTGANTDWAYRVYIDSNSFSTSSDMHTSSWFPIRPFKNDAVIPDRTWTRLYWDIIPEPVQLPKLKRIVKHNNYYFFWEKPTHASGITLNKNSITLNNAWDTEQLTATVTPEDAVNKKVLWSSSDTSVATVSSTGLVTCITPGECTITATCADKPSLTATCNVRWQPISIDFLLIWWWWWWWLLAWWWGGGWWYIECNWYEIDNWDICIIIWTWWSWATVCRWWWNNWWNSCFWDIVACWWGWGWWYETDKNWKDWWSGWWWSWWAEYWWSWACYNMPGCWVSWQWNSWWCWMNCWTSQRRTWWWWGGAWWDWCRWWCYWTWSCYCTQLTVWWAWWLWKCSCISWSCQWYAWWWSWWDLCYNTSGPVCWWWWRWWATDGKRNATWYWWWGWWSWQCCCSGRAWNWCKWIFIARYPTACWYDITWWTKYTCGDYTIHCFTSNGTLTVN